ncbi:MAG TPA: hypothetical protein VLK24_08310 [Gaiellaceae bacterium]|nr:hypothetical protein [Gaiellaceae bacterium]
MLVALGLASTTVLRASGHELLLLAVGGAALVPLLLGLAARWSPALALGVAILGGQQALRLALGPDQLDTWAPASAGFLLLVAELSWWSIEPRVPAWSEPWLAPLRLVSVLALCAAGAALAGVVLVAASSKVGGGVVLELAGVLAAISALAVVAWVARTHVR